MAAAAQAQFQVLEFQIGGKQYCVDLDHVDEIVDNNNAITHIPNSDRAVMGVMDLRGQTTTIVDPRISLGIDAETPAKYVVVFESEERPIGWLIEDVMQVADVSEENLDESVTNDAVKGVFKQGDEFTVWVDPSDIHA